MPRREPEILVLCYHAVSDGWPSSLAVPPAAFERHLEHFVRQEFHGTTFSRAVTGAGAPPRQLVVTFDDAYRSVLERAFPILERLELPATVFAPTGGDELRAWEGVDRWLGTRWESELAGATWAELRDLSHAGWEVGSHTRSHPHLTELDEATLLGELEDSRRECERRVGVACRAIAYPYGDADARVAEAARRAGYVAGAALGEPPSVPPRTNDVMLWPRLGVYREDGTRRVIIKARLFRHPRAWKVAQALPAAAREAGTRQPDGRGAS